MALIRPTYSRYLYQVGCILGGEMQHLIASAKVRRVIGGCLPVLLFPLMVCPNARASATITDDGYYRVGTTAYLSSSFPGCYL